MTDNDTVSEMRKELGHKAALKGEVPHKDASPEFSQEYRRRSMGFGSNVNPRLFGKGNNTEVTSWFCVCGHENKSNVTARKGGDIVCWICGVPRTYGEDHERNA